MRISQAILAGVVALALAASPAFARGRKNKSSNKPVSDQTFVMNAAEGGMAEVELGRLAQSNGSAQEVKSFGKRMVDDHGKANDELKTLAKNKNITIPTGLSAKDRALEGRLSKLSGEAFDRAYVSAMIKDHRKDVSEFKRESTSGRDADIKSFAGKTLPTLEDHLKLAQEMNRAVATTGRRPSKKGR